MLFSIFDVLRIYEALQIFFYKFLLKWGKNEDFESSIFFEAQKYYFVFESRLNFFPICHSRNVVSTLPNVVKIDVENHNVVSTLSNVVQFNVDVRNVASTLIWRCATSWRHINLKTTLNRRWNVCWDPSKCSLNKHICSWHDKLIILWTLVRPAKTFLPIENNLFFFFFFFGIFVTFVTLLSPNFRKVIY